MGCLTEIGIRTDRIDRQTDRRRKQNGGFRLCISHRLRNITTSEIDRQAGRTDRLKDRRSDGQTDINGWHFVLVTNREFNLRWW